jgi:hypothetical protein
VLYYCLQEVHRTTSGVFSDNAVYSIGFVIDICFCVGLEARQLLRFAQIIL